MKEYSHLNKKFNLVNNDFKQLQSELIQAKSEIIEKDKIIKQIKIEKYDLAKELESIIDK